jgi:hypothetical protein
MSTPSRTVCPPASDNDAYFRYTLQHGNDALKVAHGIAQLLNARLAMDDAVRAVRAYDAQMAAALADTAATMDDALTNAITGAAHNPLIAEHTILAIARISDRYTAYATNGDPIHASNGWSSRAYGGDRRARERLGELIAEYLPCDEYISRLESERECDIEEDITKRPLGDHIAECRPLRIPTHEVLRRAMPIFTTMRSAVLLAHRDGDREPLARMLATAPIADDSSLGADIVIDHAHVCSLALGKQGARLLGSFGPYQAGIFTRSGAVPPPSAWNICAATCMHAPARSIAWSPQGDVTDGGWWSLMRSAIQHLPAIIAIAENDAANNVRTWESGEFIAVCHREQIARSERHETIDAPVVSACEIAQVHAQLTAWSKQGCPHAHAALMQGQWELGPLATKAVHGCVHIRPPPS